jgi:hypothetical protein
MKNCITFIENDQRQGEISRWKLVLLFIEMKKKEGRNTRKKGQKKMKKEKVRSFMGWEGKEDNPK